MPISEDAKANPMVKPEIPKVLMGRGGYLSNEERIKKDEEELLAMKKEALGITDEESSEDKPSSEEPKAEPVQAESDTKQEEKPEAKAQEDDTELSAEEKNFKKRYGDLRRHSQKKEEEFNAKLAALEAKLEKATKQELVLPKSDEELEAFKQEYPDLYSTVESVAHMQSQRQVADLEAQLQSIRQRESEVMRKEAETTLKERHPDYEDLRGSDEFHAWAKEQPEQIQEWIYNNPNNVTLAVKAIDLYKMEKGITQTKSQSRPLPQVGSAADMVSTKTTSIDAKQPKIWTEREIAAMSLDQFDRYEDEIKLAMEEGRVIR